MSTRRRAGAVLMLAAVMQGLSVVALPASATVLQGELGLSAVVYGSLFVPQTIGAIAGSLVADPLARRFGLARVLALSTGLHALAQLALAATSLGAVTPMCCLAAALLGLGFGLAAVPLNAAPRSLWPARRDGALVAVHTAVALGFSLGPLVVGRLAAADRWLGYPLALGLAAAVLTGLALVTSLPAGPPAAAGRTGSAPRVLAPLVVVAIAYALAEGTFSNWATVFLHEERGLDVALAGTALSAFWAALAGGRLLATWLLVRVPAPWIWAALPPAMATVLLALPAVEGPVSGVLAFAAAGLATSAFFPLTVALATERTGVPAETVSAWLTAALMLGVGVGSLGIGALREAIGLEALYRVSAVEPLLALGIGAVVFGRARRGAAERSLV